MRIQPDFALAKNNLALYTAEKEHKPTQQAGAKTAEDWLNASLLANQAGHYQECIDDARQALKLRPNYAEAYNNIAAGYESMHKWDEAIAAANQALAINPDFQLAKNNLAWSISQKKLGVR